MLLGIDAGSTYTKYVVVDPAGEIFKKEKFETPPEQFDFYPILIEKLKEKYKIEKVGACGYGRKNIPADTAYSELTTLARGVHYVEPEVRVIIDIGGQDTKILILENGKLVDFLLNDKCAAGAGLYIKNALEILDVDFLELDGMVGDFDKVKPMSTVCAVFAQSEIIGRIAAGERREAILTAAVDFVLNQVRQFFLRVKPGDTVIFTGGLSSLECVGKRLSALIGRPVSVPRDSEYLAAYGSVLCF